MAESAEEFFTDDRLADSNLHDSASLIQTFLAEDATASETARNLTASFHAPAAANASEVLEECIVGAAEQLWDTHDALVKLVCELRSQQQQRTGENDLSEFDQSLAYSLGERWLRYGDPDPASSWRDQARLEWTNLNHFAALLYMSGVQQLSSFGEKTLEFTMKRGGWRINWEGPDSKTPSRLLPCTMLLLRSPLCCYSCYCCCCCNG